MSNLKSPSNILLILFAIFLIVRFSAGFSEPSSPPPGSNTPAPLHVGAAGQTKTGGLILNTGGASYGLIVDQGSVGIGTQSPTQKLDVAGYIRGATGLCIGSDCRTGWPSGGIQSESDTLQSVTDRGNSTSRRISVGGITTSGPVPYVLKDTFTCPSGDIAVSYRTISYQCVGSLCGSSCRTGEHDWSAAGNTPETCEYLTFAGPETCVSSTCSATALVLCNP